VTAGGVGPGDWIDEANPNWDNLMYGAHPVLDAGKQYFIGVEGFFQLPAGSLGKLLVYRGPLP
jgi:hypothetical protein